MIAYKLIVKLIVILVRGFKNIFAVCKQHVVLVLFYNKNYRQTNLIELQIKCWLSMRLRVWFLYFERRPTF